MANTFFINLSSFQVIQVSDFYTRLLTGNNTPIFSLVKKKFNNFFMINEIVIALNQLWPYKLSFVACFLFMCYFLPNAMYFQPKKLMFIGICK
ncbi:MAG: hypothetical protein A2W27_07295 [Deltaproteobacteria bacterium RBG_16_44_11]|nr:MAG: hypothetical protein A2W27_07295 [Deltaproteobacteria bacterium RBG_16_44_11]